MSSTPERDAAGQWKGGTQQGEPPSAPPQGSAPGQEHLGSAPPQGGAPGQEHFDPSGGGSGQPQGGGASAYLRDSRRDGAPVTEAATRVTWRRVFQYWVDAFLVSIIPY